MKTSKKAIHPTTKTKPASIQRRRSRSHDGTLMHQSDKNADSFANAVGSLCSMQSCRLDSSPSSFQVDISSISSNKSSKTADKEAFSRSTVSVCSSSSFVLTICSCCLDFLYASLSFTRVQQPVVSCFLSLTSGSHCNVVFSLSFNRTISMDVSFFYPLLRSFVSLRKIV